MDRPSYHIAESEKIHVSPGSSSNLFDAETGNPYVFIPDSQNPEVMPFVHSDTKPPSAVSFDFYEDPTPLNESSGVQMARIEVETSWDKTKHYDLHVHHNDKMEFIYNKPSRIPFQVLEKGILRGTALVKIHNAEVLLVPRTTKKIPGSKKYLYEDKHCETIAKGHAACFLSTPYATCAAALHSHVTGQCCGHLRNVKLFVDCHPVETITSDPSNTSRI